MPYVPTEEDKQKSARKLGIAKYLPEIEQYALPKNQASAHAAGNIVEDHQPVANPSLEVTQQVPAGGAAEDAIDAPQYVAPAAAENPYEPLAASQEVNPYDQILDQERSAQKTSLQSSMYVGTARDPDKEARVRALSKETNLPEEIVARNFDAVQRQQKVQGTDYDSLIESSPKLAEWLTDAKNSSVAHDDLDNLKATEKAAQDHSFMSDFLSNVWSGVNTMGANVAKTGTSAFDFLLRKKSFGLLDKSMVPGVDAPAKYLEQKAQDFKTPDLDKSILNSIKGGDYSAAGRSMAMQFAANAPNQAAIIAMSFFGGPAAGLGFAGGTTAGAKYEENIKKGVDPSQAMGNAVITGGIEAGFENLGTFGILKSWEASIAKTYGKKISRQVMKDFAKTLAYSVAAEGNEEALTSVAQDFTDYITGVNPKALEGMGQRAFDAGVVGGFSGGALVAPMGFAQGKAIQHAAKQTQVDQGFFKQIGEMAKNSKLWQRMPEEHKAFVEQVTNGAKMYVPVEAFTTYFQSKGIDVDQVAKDLGIEDQIEEAKTSSGEVEIPLASFVEKYGASEHFAGLENDVKFQPGPDHFTPNQLKEFEKAQEEAAKGFDQEQVAEEKRVKDEAAAKVYVDIKTKLQAIGVDPAKVEANSKLVEEFFATQAEEISKETGVPVTAHELFQGFNLEFRRFKNKTERDIFDIEQRQQMAAGMADQLKEVSQQSRKDLIAMARRALEAVPDLHKDDVAEALGLPKMVVRALKGISSRKGRGVYSKSEILNAAGSGQGETYSQNLSQSKAQPAVAPPFYSKLTQTVEQKMGGSATVEQINGMIREIKPEERKWLGLDEFLAGKEKVSKAELLEHLRANALEVKEVLLGEDSGVSVGQEVFGVYGPDGENEASFKSIDAARKYIRETVENDDGDLDMNSFSIQKEEYDGQTLEDYDGPVSNGSSGPTKFSQYTLPGGENYREVLFQLPPKAEGDIGRKFQDWAAKKYGDKWLDFSDEKLKELERDFKNQYRLDTQDKLYRSSHFNEPNVLAHTRLNDRVDADGKKVLFVEEIQSDWHQAGRKKGYKGGEMPTDLPPDAYVTQVDGGYAVRQDEFLDMNTVADTPEAAIEKFHRKRDRAVPDAPFRKTWHEFVLKRLIREAAEKGYDKVAWTTGEQQAERYDLSKQVDEVQAFKNENGTFDIEAWKGGSILIEESGINETRIEALVGKDLAEKIVAESGEDIPLKGGKAYSGEALKAGGAGMKGFYDKILVDFANKFGKKYGAKVGEAEIGTDGSSRRYEVVRQTSGEDEMWTVRDTQRESTVVFDAGSEAAAEKEAEALNSEHPGEVQVHSLEITPELKKAALEEGFSLFQGGEQDPRGQIQIMGRTFNIDIFDEADPSTIPHELNHFLFEAMGHIAEGEGKASPSVQEKYRKVLDWLGAKSREDVTVEQHEKLSDALLHFYKTGEAPSTSLREAFAMFRRWFSELWKKVAIQRVDIPEDVKQAMARWFATDEQIAEAKQTLGMTQDLKVPELSDATKAELERLRERARTKAEQDLLNKKLEVIHSEYQKKLAEERAKFRKAAEEQVSQEPLFQAIDSLGKNAYTLAEKALNGELSAKQSAEFELLADEHGFVTAQDMAEQMVDAKAQNLFEEKVGALVTEGLNQIGMIKDAAQVREEAVRAMHSEDQAELLAFEKEAYLELAGKRAVRKEAQRRNRAIAREEAKAAAAVAQRLLSAKPAAEAARPQVYITQERNAAARVARFLAKKDYVKAAEAKGQQLIAHAMVRESFRINEEYEKHIKYVEQFQNRGGNLLEMPYGFVRQVDALLAKYGFQAARSEDVKVNQEMASRMEGEGDEPNYNDIANATGLVKDKSGAWSPETLEGFIERQNDNYHAMILPDSVRMMTATDPKKMTLQELADFRETVQMIVVGGRKNNRFLTEFIKVDAKAAAKEIRESIEAKVGAPREGERSITAGNDSGLKAKAQAILNLPDAMIPSMVNVETLASYLDGGDKNGPVRRMIYRLMSLSEDKKQVMTEKAIKEMNAILEKFYKPDELAAYKTEKRFAIRGQKDALTKEQILSMALNWGNQTNRDRVLMGYNIDQATAQDLLNNLEQRDWEFAQAVWDYIDTFWPDIKRLEMKVKGVEPAKVEATKVVTKFGVFKGGYYPIAYDYNKSADAYKMNEQRSELYKQFSAASAQTERGHAEARVTRVKRPVRLSLDVIYDHLENVIHDIAYREAVIDVNRLLREQDVKTAIQNAIGMQGYLTFDKWLQDIASDQRVSLQSGEQLMRWFRMKTTMSTLGFRAFTLPMDLSGNVINVVHEIGPSRMAKAIADHVFGRGETNEFVIEKSDYMRQREKTMDRDLGDLSRRWTKEKPPLDRAFSKLFGKDVALSHFAFFFQRFADDALAKPLWKEVYRQSLGNYSEEEAIQLANEAVKRTMGSGSSIDLVGAQRGSEFKKIMTMYYSWSSMMFNRAWLDGKMAGLAYRQGDVGKALMVAAKGAFMLWGLHAVNEIFWREFLRNSAGHGDDEEKKKRIAARFLSQPFGYMWLGRDAGAFLVNAATGQRGGVRFSPIETALETVLKPPGKAVYFAFTDPKKFDAKYFEESARAASVMLGTPQTLNTMAFNFIDIVDKNGEATWRDALSRRTKK